MTRPHFLGTEESESPLVPDLAAAAKALAEVPGVGNGAVSARYGRRVVVNAAGVPLDALGPAHFVEVADYDPHTDQVLCLGPFAPHAFAALHALVYRAKAEVNALAHAVLADAARVPSEWPRVARGGNALETVMVVLRSLRDADALVLDEREVMAVGATAEKAVDRVRAAVTAEA